MSDHQWRDRDRAVAAVERVVGDRALAEEVIDALAAEAVELPHPVRDFIRRRLPNGARGFVCEDIDLPLVLRTFGSNYQTDEVGQIRLVETKHRRNPELGRSKAMTFGVLDQLCRRGDRCEGRYHGFSTLVYDVHPPEHERAGQLAAVWVDGVEMNAAQFHAWLSFDETPLELLSDAALERLYRDAGRS